DSAPAHRLDDGSGSVSHAIEKVRAQRQNDANWRADLVRRARQTAQKGLPLLRRGKRVKLLALVDEQEDVLEPTACACAQLCAEQARLLPESLGDRLSLGLTVDGLTGLRRCRPVVRCQ